HARRRRLHDRGAGGSERAAGRRLQRLGSGWKRDEPEWLRLEEGVEAGARAVLLSLCGRRLLAERPAERRGRVEPVRGPQFRTRPRSVGRPACSIPTDLKGRWDEASKISPISS